MSTMSDSHPLHEVGSTLGASPHELRAIVAEFADLISIHEMDGVRYVTGDGLRYLRAAHRWRSRGMSWEDIRSRFSEIERSGLEPYPRQIEWADEEQAAAADALPQEARILEPERETGHRAGDAAAIVDALKKELERTDRARREDFDRVSVSLSRLEKEIQLLRNEIAGTLCRRDRKKRWLGR